MPPPQTTGAHHVSLTVTDLDRSREFYQRVVGLTETLRAADRVALHDGTAGYILLPAPPDAPPDSRRFDERQTGLDHLAFRVASPDAVHQAAAHLDACGVPHSGAKPGRLKDSLLVVFRDPDNIQLEFYYSP